MFGLALIHEDAEAAKLFRARHHRALRETSNVLMNGDELPSTCSRTRTHGCSAKVIDQYGVVEEDRGRLKEGLFRVPVQIQQLAGAVAQVPDNKARKVLIAEQRDGCLDAALVLPLEFLVTLQITQIGSLVRVLYARGAAGCACAWQLTCGSRKSLGKSRRGAY